MTYPLDKRKEEMAEMIELIPKMQAAVRRGLNRHYTGMQDQYKKDTEVELQKLRKGISILESKYVLDIIFVLSREEEEYFFNDLKKILFYVNVATLSKRLKRLVLDGVIKRNVFPDQSPIRVSYCLTKLGHGIFRLLLPLLVYISYHGEINEKSDI